MILKLLCIALLSILLIYSWKKLVESIINLRCLFSKEYKSNSLHYKEGGIVLNTKTGKMENTSNKLTLPFD